MRLRTLIPGQGVKGTYRIANSTRIYRAMKSAGLRETFDRLRLWLGYGLHLELVARKPT
jgi:hypothetical protein